MVAVSAFAEKQPLRKRFGKFNHHKHENVMNSPEIKELAKKPNSRPAFVHPHMDDMRRVERDMNKHANHLNKFVGKKLAKKDSSSFKTAILPGKTYYQNIDMMSVFTIPFKKGETIAVQIVRSSDLYDFGTKSPILRRCGGAIKCAEDKNNNSLSFEVTPKVPAKKGHGINQYEFSLTTTHSLNSGVAVGIYVCVGKNASLATCYDKNASSRNCSNGSPSKVANVCICDKGYTGINCSKEALPAPKYDYDSVFDEHEAILRLMCYIVAGVIKFVLFIVIIIIIASCCTALRLCCIRRRRRNGTVVRNGVVRSMPPPPPYVRAGAYHPLNIPPPPPPPPPMERGQRYDAYDKNAIEMTTLPAARAANPNPVFIMPPLAPVRTVPVFVQAPVPKN